MEKILDKVKEFSKKQNILQKEGVCLFPSQIKNGKKAREYVFAVKFGKEVIVCSSDFDPKVFRGAELRISGFLFMKKTEVFLKVKTCKILGVTKQAVKENSLLKKLKRKRKKHINLKNIKKVAILVPPDSMAKRDLAFSLSFSRRFCHFFEFPFIRHQMFESFFELLAENFDLILIARGGGRPWEILEVGNNLKVCKAVLSSRTVVFCALGHASDRPLLELCSSHSFITPTEAGIRVSRILQENNSFIKMSIWRCFKILKNKLLNKIKNFYCISYQSLKSLTLK